MFRHQFACVGAATAACFANVPFKVDHSTIRTLDPSPANARIRATNHICHGSRHATPSDDARARATDRLATRLTGIHEAQSRSLWSSSPEFKPGMPLPETVHPRVRYRGNGLVIERTWSRGRLHKRRLVDPDACWSVSPVHIGEHARSRLEVHLLTS